LLHIVLCQNRQQNNDFDIADVYNEICDKLIHRHPHIYSDTVVKDEEEVKQNWEKLKLKIGNLFWRVVPGNTYFGKTSRIQDKVKGVGFDWEEPHQVWDKVQEELEELQVERSNR